MIRYNKIDPALFVSNRERLVNLLSPNSLAIIHSNDSMPRNGDQFFSYRQNSDFFYLTGLEEENAVLLLCPNHSNEALREVLFIPQYTDNQKLWDGEKYSIELASNFSGIANVLCHDSFNLVLKEAMEFAALVYLNSNEYPKFTTEVLSKDLRFSAYLLAHYPAHKYSRLQPLLKELRLIKQDEELKQINKACSITAEVFDNLLKQVRPGMIEYEIEAEITGGFIRRAAGNSFKPIVAAGRNACVLHYTANNKVIENGELILLDFGAEYANYASDCSRIIPVSGKFTPRQKEVYNAVLGVFRAALQLIRPGITINKLNDKVGQLMETALISLGLISAEEVINQDPSVPLYKRYFMHGTSHFIGLDVHDPGTKDVILMKGMVLSCEPGIYIQEENIGIRLENTILVGDKPIDLMEGIPIEADEIERLMSAP
jgi:Xaa-Pro aminopeptidase